LRDRFSVKRDRFSVKARPFQRTLRDRFSVDKSPARPFQRG
jgi:hypothetical protein